MIRIHTGGCPVCGGPIFVDFKQVAVGIADSCWYIFYSKSYHGKIGSVIHSCECVVKAEPEEPHTTYADPFDGE